MDLKNLVPPLELCQLIPQGEFEDSALCWVDADGWNVAPRNKVIDICHNEKHPAPTLQEIMAKIPHCRVCKKNNRNTHCRSGQDKVCDKPKRIIRRAKTVAEIERSGM